MDLPGMLPETVSRPSHITALRNVKFVAGSGRRYMAGCVAVVLGQLYGSWMLMIWNSALGGTGIEMRSRALLSSWLYAARRACMVEKSPVGQFAPSTGRNTGSVPCVTAKRICTSCGVMVHASVGMWQVTQDRPFVPRLLKNGFLRSIFPA